MYWFWTLAAHDALKLHPPPNPALNTFKPAKIHRQFQLINKKKLKFNDENWKSSKINEENWKFSFIINRGLTKGLS